MVRIDAVVGTQNPHGFTAPIRLLAVFADKGRSGHEVISTFWCVLLEIFIDESVDFLLFLLRKGRDRFSLLKKAVDKGLRELHLRRNGI